MRAFFLALLFLNCSYAYELTYISNNPSIENLKMLSKTYKQALLLNDNKVYLIPSDCRLERYFGGFNQDMPKSSIQAPLTQETINSQEVFEAKDETVLKEKVELEKSIALVEGKVPKAFLDDTEKRGFGGASEIPLDFTFQRIEAKKVHMKPAQEHKPIIEKAKAYQHPSCKLLDDATGYQLIHLKKDAKFFINGNLSSVHKNIVKFK